MPTLDALRALAPTLAGHRAYRVLAPEPDFAAAPARALVVRLSPLRDVDRSVTHLVLADSLKRGLPGILVDLAFLPGRADSERLTAAGIPWLHGTRTLRPAGDFDLILVSNAYALELLNLPLLLLRSGIPVRASARPAGFPPLLLGGSNAAAALAVLGPGGESIPDALFFGEGERALERLAGELPKLSKVGKHIWLKGACGGSAPGPPPEGPKAPPDLPSSVSGLWVPGADAPATVDRAILREPEPRHLFASGPLLDTPEAGTARVTVNLGCAAFCAFCFEGYDRKPYREPPAESILEAARSAKTALGAREIELYGFNVNTHREIGRLLLELSRLFERVSLKSQRADCLEGTPGLLEAEFAIGKASFTVGVEGISTRMRRFLRKSLDDASLDRLLKRLLAANAPVRELKLFFILTGREEASDFADFRALLRRVNALAAAGRRTCRIVASAGYLVRMPGTPLAHDPPVFDEPRLSRLAREAKAAAEDAGIEFRLAADCEEYAATQALVRAGEEEAGGLEALETLAAQGFRYDGALDRGVWPALRAALAARGTPAHAPRPGPALEGGVSPAFLERAHASARVFEDPGYCLGDSCRACGACTGAERGAITGHRVAPVTAKELAELTNLVAAKRRLKPIHYRATLPAAWGGVLRETLNALLLRAFLAAHPAEVDNLLFAEEAFFTRPDLRDRFPAFYGETWVALAAWDAARLAAALERGAPLAARPSPPPPETFTALDLALDLPRVGAREAETALSAFLAGQRVPFHVEGKAGGRRFVVPPRGRKKGVLDGATVEAAGAGARLTLTAGRKFDLAPLLRRLGPASAEVRAVG